MNTKNIPVKIDGLSVDVDAVAKHRGQILNLGMLGGKYFTISAVETYPDFDKKQHEHKLQNSMSFIPNRTPRRFAIRDHEVFAQALSTTPDGTTKVVFNPGTGEEAKATIIDGGMNFGDTTDEAIGNALIGQKVIFANAVKLVEKANEYNQAEVDRLTTFIKQLQEQRDSIISTMKRNTACAQTYEQEILSSKPRTTISSGTSSPSIVIESASSIDD